MVQENVINFEVVAGKTYPCELERDTLMGIRKPAAPGRKTRRNDAFTGPAT